MSTARTPPPNDSDPESRTSGGATGGFSGVDPLPTNPRGQNPAGLFINRQMGRMDTDVRAALENAERLVVQTTTRLAAEEARVMALDQQMQAMQAQGPSILAALDSQTTNKVLRWGGAPGDFSVELWLNQVEMLRTMNKWTAEQTKKACFLSMEDTAAIWKQATLRAKGPDARLPSPSSKRHS